MDNNIGTIVIVVLFAAIGFYLYKYTNIFKKKNEGFAMKQHSFKDIYDGAVSTLADDGILEMGRHIVLNTTQIHNIKDNIVKRMNSYYGNTDLRDVIDGFGDEISSALKDEASKVGQLTPEFTSYISEVITKKAKHYLTYLDTRFDMLDVYGADKGRTEDIIPHPLESKFSTKKGVKMTSPLASGITGELHKAINADHPGHGRKQVLGFNSHNLTMDLKRTGFASTIGRKNPGGDLRGKTRTMIKKLAMMASTKDPNSLVRAADGDINSYLHEGKGISNHRMWKDEYAKWADATGKPEWKTFRHVSGRFLTHDQFPDKLIHKNVNDGILSDIKMGR